MSTGIDRVSDNFEIFASTSDNGRALTPLALVASYDTLRLSLYDRRAARGLPISIAHIGHSTLLRFDDVSYFNRVYGLDAEVEHQLPSIEKFFEASPHGCQLQALEHEALADSCRRRGWTPEVEYAWVSGPVTRTAARPSKGLAIRPPRQDESEQFLRTYLEAFDAASERVPAAIENMRHLFAESSLHPLLAFDGDTPVGVGMLRTVGTDALFCAGAMIASHRNIGGHEALLAARFDMARTLGCSRVHSWAYVDSQSHRNLIRTGLETVAVSRAWRWRPPQTS